VHPYAAGAELVGRFKGKNVIKVHVYQASPSTTSSVVDPEGYKAPGSTFSVGLRARGSPVVRH